MDDAALAELRAQVIRRIAALPAVDLRLLNAILDELPACQLVDTLRAQVLRGVELWRGPRVNVPTNPRTWAQTSLLTTLRAFSVACGIPFPAAGNLPGGDPA